MSPALLSADETTSQTLCVVLSVTAVVLMAPPREAFGSVFPDPPLNLSTISEATIGMLYQNLRMNYYYHKSRKPKITKKELSEIIETNSLSMSQM